MRRYLYLLAILLMVGATAQRISAAGSKGDPKAEKATSRDKGNPGP